MATNQTNISETGETAGIIARETSGSTVQNGTTHWIDSGVVNTAQNTTLLTQPSSITSCDYVYQDIKAFLAKPLIAGDYVLTNALTLMIDQFDITRPIYNNTAPFDIWYHKLIGIHGIRCTFVYTLKINASRFDQGMYLLAFQPSGGVAQTAAQYITYSHSRNQVSQLLHAKLDVNCDSSVTIRVPWISTHSFLPMTPYSGSRLGSPGRIQLWALEPITTVGGTGSAGATLYVHLEDVELFASTTPQCGLCIGGDKVSVHFQAGTVVRRKKKDIHTEEVESNRTISNSLKLATDISSALSPIPLLSSIAAPMSWLLDAASRAAYAWGYSAPRINDPSNRMTKWSNPYLCNYNKKSVAQTLALSSTNTVGQVSGIFGTDIDEMSFDFIKQRSAIYARFTISTSNSTGDLLYSCLVTPRDMYSSTIDSTNTMISFTPVGFLSRLFNLWRGSMIYTFTIVKTEFHIGRLMVVFTPYALLAGPVITASLASYCLREIIDIRAGNQFQVTIPYISAAQYMTCQDAGGQTGTLSVYLVDALEVGGTQTNTTISVFVDVKGGPDFEVASRSAGIELNFTQANTYQSAVDTIGGTKLDPCKIETTVIGEGSEHSSKNYNFASSNLGEVTESFSSLLKAGGILNYPQTITSQPQTYSWAINPTIVLMSKINVNTYVGGQYYDIFSRIVPLYALMRGTIRLSIYETPNVLLVATVWRAYPKRLLSDFNQGVVGMAIDGNVNTYPPIDDLAPMYNNGIIIKDVTDAGVIVDVPQYTKFAATATWAEVSTMAVATARTQSTTDQGRRTILYYERLVAGGLGYDSNTIGLTVHRSVGDDFRLGCFISIPPIRYNF
uniref:Picornavirus capsid domain-containing protein n=2 Tax=Picornavirales sp. TaxID=1955153 RepID=A0A514D8C4_9VIRU|nr:MAG: hypothetical protein H4Rhizo43795_000001 [Picornavirales sp.]